MYKKYLEIRPTPNRGNGAFSTVRIPANSPIMEITGKIYLDREMVASEADQYLQVGPNTYLGLSGEVDDYLNHSCNPNCYVNVIGNRAILYSMYVIPIGAELTFDYSTTSTETTEQWKMDCLCGATQCRKVISGFQYLPDSLKDDYKKKNILPIYITHSIIQPK